MKQRIFCNWMTPASNIVIQSQFGRLATADVLGLKPLISLSLDWLCRITAGFPQHSRWWRLKGISSRSLILLPIHALIVHYFATGMENAPCSCMMLTLNSKTRAEVQGPRSPAGAHPSLPCIAEICWGQPASRIRCLPFPTPMWHRHTGITGNSHLRWQ